MIPNGEDNSELGIQFNGGKLISNVIGDDIMISGNNKTIIYNLDGEIITKEFKFVSDFWSF